MRRLAAGVVFAVVAVVACGVATIAAAQEPTPTWPAAQRSIADWSSTVSVGAQLAAATVDAWRAPDRRSALLHEARAIGCVVAVSELLKRIVRRDRPDGSDRFSFPSEHTGLAVAGGSYARAPGWFVAVNVGYLRMAAAKHHPSDVLAGAVVGLACRQ